MYRIWGRDDCEYCNRAIDLLDYEGEPFEYFNISNSPHLRKQFDLLGVTTVPAIYIGFKYIGGYDQLRERINNGKT